MQPVDQDIIAALLKSVWDHGLIPESTYRAALNKVVCTSDMGNSTDHDSAVKPRRTA